jgi:hypothetical protein
MLHLALFYKPLNLWFALYLTTANATVCFPIFCSSQVTIIFLKKLDLLLSKTPADSIRDDVLPMVFRALEAPSIEIQVSWYSLFKEAGKGILH